MNKVKTLFIFSIILSLTFPLQSVGSLMSNNSRNVEERVSYPDIKSSALIEEDEDEFLEGAQLTPEIQQHVVE